MFYFYTGMGLFGGTELAEIDALFSLDGINHRAYIDGSKAGVKAAKAITNATEMTKQIEDWSRETEINQSNKRYYCYGWTLGALIWALTGWLTSEERVRMLVLAPEGRKTIVSTIASLKNHCPFTDLKMKVQLNLILKRVIKSFSKKAMAFYKNDPQRIIGLKEFVLEINKIF